MDKAGQHPDEACPGAADSDSPDHGLGEDVEYIFEDTMHIPPVFTPVALSVRIVVTKWFFLSVDSEGDLTESSGWHMRI